jgi:hypothetical protein
MKRRERTMKSLIKKYPRAEPSTMGDDGDVCIFTPTYRKYWETRFVNKTMRRVKVKIEVTRRSKDKILSMSFPQFPEGFRNAVARAWADAIKRHG